MGVALTANLPPWLTAGNLNLGIFLCSALGATLLHAARLRNGVATKPGQWLSDASGVGTILLLVILVVASLFPGISVVEQVVRENSYLITLAFFYCAVMTTVNLIKSISERA